MAAEGILFTKNHFGRKDLSEFHAVLLDLDLSILCSEPQDYDVYSAGIVKEYAHVKPLELLCEKRAEVLEKFLGHEKFYYSSYFGPECEKRARDNMTREIAQLKKIC